MDGIMPIMLQQGFEPLAGKLLMLLRASLALGYIPMSWRHTRVVFVPKPGKPFIQAKSLRAISLMSFILKTLEKLLDRHIRGVVLVENPFHQNQFGYRAGMSTETALFQIVQRLEKCLEHKEIALGAFLDIEGAFDNTSFKTIMTARERGLEETCCRWIGSMLRCKLVHVSLMGSSLTAKVAGGCPQGGVLSPLLWNLVIDRLLTVINDIGFRTFSYADDIVIIVQGKFAPTVRELTFRARASYRLGRHVNTSAFPQARASHTLGQPQPQPFKYFALNIFRDISLILSPRSFSSFMLRLIYQLRENNMYPFFI
jgi:hypothetical protein